MTKSEMILLLSFHPKLGAQSIKRTLSAFEDAEKIIKAPYGQMERKVGGKIATFVKEALNKYSLEGIKSNLNKNDIGYITISDKKYPSLLAEIPDCPAILFIKGDCGVLNQISIGVVGSRKYTSYGARVARKFSASLASSGLSIVSGLALGIDASAHRAALESNGVTVGVLGCGLDKIYPASNSALANQIINSGGAIISEYPPGTEPFKSNFPARNRIIAGLSLGTLVVEAALGSGALITAMAALEYNRAVYAIPGPIDSVSSEGTNYLIQQGAMLVQKHEDIINDLDIPVKKAEQVMKAYSPGTPEEEVVIGIVSDKSYCADDILKMCDLNVASLTYTLTMLEMKGILENVGGNWRKKL